MANTRINVTPNGQGKLTTCWFAAYKTMWMWKNKTQDVDVAAAPVLQAIRGAGLVTEPMYERGMWPGEYPIVAKALGMNTFRTPYVQTWDVATVAQFLDSYGPMFVCMYDPNHAMVLIGANEDADERKQLEFMNPWNEAHQGSPSWHFTSMSWFTNNLQEYDCSLQFWK